MAVRYALFDDIARSGGRVSSDDTVAAIAHPDAAIAETLVSLIAPTSFAADQYRSLRHTIERLRREGALQILAITSPGPGDGKTVTALNVAGAMAQGRNMRVLVVDADLRRPSVAEYLGFEPHAGPGLAELLDDPAVDLSAAVRRLDRYGLFVLPSGAPQYAPYELLNGSRFEALLREARHQFDCVIVDTPPLVALPDSRLIAKSVDGFLLVVAAHKTPRHLVAEALTLLDPSKLLGIVFNADDRSLSGRYGYYHDYYQPRRGPSDSRRRIWKRGHR